MAGTQLKKEASASEKQKEEKETSAWILSPVEIGASPEESVETLFARARKGGGADSAREYMGGYMWARLWKAVTRIANCPPDLSTLLMYRAEIAVCMKISQEMQLDMANANVAAEKIKKLFSTPAQI